MNNSLAFGKLLQEQKAVQSLGNLNAIKAVTFDAVRILMGDDCRFGRTASGFMADMLIVKGDPSVKIENLKNVRRVYIARQTLYDIRAE